jgi:diguanylate cyclase (GGDEF)-like protein
MGSQKLLLVEDSHLVIKVLKHLIHDHAEFQADFAENYAEAKRLIEQKNNGYFSALVDLNLPDAPKGEIVDLVLHYKIPTIVLTGSYSEEKKDELIKKGIVDYVIKETRYSYLSAIKIINRLNKNHRIKIMVVDDSLLARKQCTRLLEKYLFQVVEANSAKQAIQMLKLHSDIKLVITDYNMPVTDGFELVKIIRSKYDKENLVILGLSGSGDSKLSARFIKNGANDFLTKPFAQEEFYCRIMHNIETLESIEKIKESVHRDYLTKLFNRQYFYLLANKKLIQQQKIVKPAAIAVIEIDHFKIFNNIYHNYGDNVVFRFSELLSLTFPYHLIGRLSSAQFVIYFESMNEKEAFDCLEYFRKTLTNETIHLSNDEENHCLSMSASVTSIPIKRKNLQDEWNLNSLLERCDRLLVRARDAGKNIIVYD